MTKKDLKKYRLQLEQDRVRILDQLNFDKEQIKDLEKRDIGDIIDRAFNMYEKGRAIEMSEKEKRELAAIDEALLRIKKGTYGVCAICGSAINLDRLNAIPWAATCVNPSTCKKKRKLRRATTGS
ncbi:hypothetical protein COTS27_00380 [Spirochaetota bacterium]|nr:hypothetical protein COTS27_00380 [Spirochaetota bacterium]